MTSDTVSCAVADAVRGCRCGTAYQAVLSRRDVSMTIGRTAHAIMKHMKRASFSDSTSCSKFIEDNMVQGLCRKATPRFHSVEAAKDLCYFRLEKRRFILNEHECPLGKGARLGLTHVRKERTDQSCDEYVLAEELGISQKDIEQALCEFEKYIRYGKLGITRRTMWLGYANFSEKRTRLKIKRKTERPPTTFRPKKFAAFVHERQKILQSRKFGNRGPFTRDLVLQRGRFCNIDRREDRGTKTLKQCARNLDPYQKVLLTLAYRFTQSRPGNQHLFRDVIEKAKKTHIEP